jgi:hypothetical protein
MSITARAFPLYVTKIHRRRFRNDRNHNEGRHADPSGLNSLPKPCSKPRTANLPRANTDDFAKPLAEAVAQEKKMTPRLLGIICRVRSLSINFGEEILD